MSFYLYLWFITCSWTTSACKVQCKKIQITNIYISKQALDFCTVHSLLNDINLIDSCQAHLPVQYALNIYSICLCDTGVVIDSEPHLSRTCKTSFLFAPLTVCVHTGCFAFSFCTPTKPLIQLHIKYKTVLFP